MGAAGFGHAGRVGDPFARATQLVGFDFEGTIVSSRVAQEASHRTIAHLAEVHANAAPRPSLPKEAELLAEARAVFATFSLEILAHEGSKALNAPILKQLKLLHARGVRLALVTSTPEAIIRPALAVLGLLRYFDVVIASSPDGDGSKGALLAQAVERNISLGSYIGDSDEDAAACAALGIPFTRYDETTGELIDA